MEDNIKINYMNYIGLIVYNPTKTITLIHQFTDYNKTI